jgi:serine/threonine protein kinase
VGVTAFEQGGQALGGERFVVQRRLGAGGMGVVYQAHDRERNQVVALKTLRDLDAAGLVRFKNEFRSLADVAHPNLVTLYELVSVAGRFMFTMELVEGESFLRYVRSDHRGDRRSDARLTPTDQMPTPITEVTAVGKRSPSSDPGLERPVESGTGGLDALDMPRLRSVLVQLARGVQALHDIGMLHRDLKPSNVLVTRDGRLKILDFGLVTELARERSGPSEPGLAGTAAYMSPEQGAQLPLTPASDWYAVGVMLYEALTGGLPFSGSPPQILVEKQQYEPAPPSARVSGVPSDLDALCVELLRRYPSARPAGRDILRRLGDDPGVAVAPSRSSSQGPRLTGRARHLEALDEAFHHARAGRTVVRFVHGESGMGKTSLVRHFLEEAESEGAVVLAGRCYERESVPYKALDSLIDALGHHLVRLGRIDAESLMPRDVHALARLFPVLRQVESVAAAPRRSAQSADPHEHRRRGFAALRELLQRIGDRRPVVLALDDLQWGDADSAALLGALLEPPDSPALLLVACHRTEDRQHSPFVRELHAALAHPLDVGELEVGPLERDDAIGLAHQLLSDGSGAVSPLAQQIAVESGGNPLFIDELARHARESLQKATNRGITLDRVLRERLLRLPVDAACLLEAIAVAGTPIALATAQRAAEVVGQQPLAVLKAANLVRTRGDDSRRLVECYHDRIRSAACELLDATALKRVHSRLARALESSPSPDPEAVAVHLRGAGEHARAADFVQLAAARAADALAFDRAAALLRMALELHAGSADESRALKRQLADALAHAGRGPEAAEVYLDALTRASAAEAIELRRLAAQELLRSGHLADGMRTIQQVLDVTGMKLPTSRTGAMLSLGWERARIRLRGLSFEERDASQLAPDVLTRIDAAHAITAGLALVDAIRGAAIQAQQLLLSLDAGEPHRALRALAAEAVFVALRGVKAAARSAQVLARVDALARRLDTPTALATASGTTGIIAHFEGRFRASIEPLERAEEIFRDRCSGRSWERSTAQIFHLYSLSVLGRMRELTARLDQLVAEARSRGDLYAQTNLAITIGFQCRLAEDRPEEARRSVREALARWNAPDEFHIQHFNALIAEVCIDLYFGDPEAAWARLATIERFRKVGLMRVQIARISTFWARAGTAIAAARRRPELLAAAERDMRGLAREGVGWATAVAALVRAGIAGARGQTDAGVRLLGLAEPLLEESGMQAQLAALRWVRGNFVGGEIGRQLLARANAFFEAEGVRNPARFAAFYVPGFAE